MPRPFLRQYPVPQERVMPFVESMVNGGLVTQIDSADIEPSQFVIVTNFAVRDDKMVRRYGTTLYTPIKPDSSAVLLITDIKRFTGPTKIMRFTVNSVHIMDWGGAVWTAITGPAFAADDTVRVKMVRLADRTFFTDGITNIKEINLTANTYANAGNAPKARYVAGFFNRLVAAYYTDSLDVNPIQIGWSGDNNFSEFDPLVDYSAGFAYLAESPSDYSDFIMGIFPMANSMIIMKEKSIWLATKQPSASNPFNFFTIVPGIGCDGPETIQKIPNGIIWYDSRIGTVFIYLVGMTEPKVVGQKIAKTLLGTITDPNHLTSTYDPLNGEYSLIYPSHGPWPQAGVTRIWKYNFRNEAWSYDEIMDVTSVSYIEDTNVRRRMYGQYDGDILVDDFTQYVPQTVADDAGVAYTSTLVSKTFELPTDDTYIQSLRIEYTPRLAGAFTVSYSKDNGMTWTVYKTVTFLSGDIGKRMVERFVKHLKARQFTWKLSGTTGLYEIIQFAITTVAGSTSKE